MWMVSKEKELCGVENEVDLKDLHRPFFHLSLHLPTKAKLLSGHCLLNVWGLCHSLPEVSNIPVNQKKCKLKNHGVFMHVNYVEAISKPRLRPDLGVARLLKMLIRLRWTPLSRRHAP